jgi:hypothetical protein
MKRSRSNAPERHRAILRSTPQLAQDPKGARWDVAGSLSSSMSRVNM